MRESSTPAPRRPHKPYKNTPTEPREPLALAAPVSLVAALDAYCATHGTDRSKAIRAALRLLLASSATP